MRKQRVILTVFLTVMAGFIWMGSASAVKPGNDVNPNGFPDGFHYNLNILGKNAEFVCPGQEYYVEIIGPEGDLRVGEIVPECPLGYICQETDLPIYGNVIFVREEGGIHIYLESGTGGKAAGIPKLQVTDPCGTDGEAALQLPKSENGYRVYARALGKPTGEPYYKIVTNPSMTITQDDRGDYLVYLGELTENGFIGADGDKFTVRKKGKSRAIDITGLFDWTGNVCAFLDGTTDLTPTPVCWADNPDSPDLLVNYGDLFTMPGSGVCPEGYLLVTDALSCTYYQDTWMFNVAEFVQAIWGLDNNGMKHLQLRFYPNGTDQQDDEADEPMS